MMNSNACPRVVIKPTPQPPAPTEGISNDTLFCILYVIFLPAHHLCLTQNVGPH
jgi:hypothetical protein